MGFTKTGVLLANSTSDAGRQVPEVDVKAPVGETVLDRQPDGDRQGRRRNGTLLGSPRQFSLDQRSGCSLSCFRVRVDSVPERLEVTCVLNFRQSIVVIAHSLVVDGDRMGDFGREKQEA
ncbi:hypothetical protein MMC28_003880 [Mycoblastus sanguinarius]|nr:hypothetical protein [Mycoblastus sanguinarius]